MSIFLYYLIFHIIQLRARFVSKLWEETQISYKVHSFESLMLDANQFSLSCWLGSQNNT